MEKRKNWVLRPVAWVCTLLMFLAVQFLADLLCKLGVFLVGWLSYQSTAIIIIMVMLFGGVFLSLIYCSVLFLPSILVSLSDKIYPSHHAFRYFFLGIYEIVGCALLIFAGIIGAVRGGSMFWFYAQYIYLIVISILVMVFGNNTAKERVSNQS